jgi:hypothetical protein
MKVGKLFILDKNQYFETINKLVNTNDPMIKYIHPKFGDKNEKMIKIYVAHSISYLILKYVKELSENEIEDIRQDVSKLNDNNNNMKELIKIGFNIDPGNSTKFLDEMVS